MLCWQRSKPREMRWTHTRNCRSLLSHRPCSVPSQQGTHWTLRTRTYTSESQNVTRQLRKGPTDRPTVQLELHPRHHHPGPVNRNGEMKACGAPSVAYVCKERAGRVTHTQTGTRAVVRCTQRLHMKIGGLCVCVCVCVCVLVLCGSKVRMVGGRVRVHTSQAHSHFPHALNE